MRKSLYILMFVMFIFLLSACGTPAVKTEGEIISQLQEHPGFQERFPSYVDIQSFKIVERQTDTDNKVDFVYADIIVNNNLVEWETTYTLVYRLHDQGWSLNSISYDPSFVVGYKYDIRPLTPAGREYADEKMASYDNYKFLEENFDPKAKTSTYMYEVIRKGDIANTTINVMVNFEFDTQKCEWVGNMQSTLVGVDWNLEGIWFKNGFEVEMVISDVTKNSAYIEIVSRETSSFNKSREGANYGLPLFNGTVKLTDEGVELRVQEPAGGRRIFDIRITQHRVEIANMQIQNLMFSDLTPLYENFVRQ